MPFHDPNLDTPSHLLYTIGHIGQSRGDYIKCKYQEAEIIRGHLGDGLSQSLTHTTSLHPFMDEVIKTQRG